jgi:hypothetical protein
MRGMPTLDARGHDSAPRACSYDDRSTRESTSARRHHFGRRVIRPESPRTSGSSLRGPRAQRRRCPSGAAKQLRIAPLHFVGADILDVVTDVPAVAEGVAHDTGTLAVELIAGRTLERGAGREAARDNRVGIVDVQVDRHRRGARRERTGTGRSRGWPYALLLPRFRTSCRCRWILGFSSPFACDARSGPWRCEASGSAIASTLLRCSAPSNHPWCSVQAHAGRTTHDTARSRRPRARSRRARPASRR